jgi:hypothetical protein
VGELAIDAQGGSTGGGARESRSELSIRPGAAPEGQGAVTARRV